jgi:hypothetical protein
MIRFLEVVYYDAYYNGIFVILSHEEMLFAEMGNDKRYAILELYLVIEDV